MSASRERLEEILAGHRVARQWLLGTLEDDLTPAQLLFQLPGGSSSIHWLAGHLAWSQEAIVCASIGVQPALPAEYFKLFGIRSKASADGAGYPGMKQILEALKARTDAAHARLAGMTDADLGNPMPDGHPAKEFFGTIEGMLLRWPLHEGYHAGQITLLRKAQGLKAGFGV